MARKKTAKKSTAPPPTPRSVGPGERPLRKMGKYADKGPVINRKVLAARRKEGKAGVKRLLMPPKRFERFLTKDGIATARAGQKLDQSHLVLTKNKKGEDVSRGQDVKRFREWFAQRNEILKEGADAFNAKVASGDAGAKAAMKQFTKAHKGRGKGRGDKGGGTESGSPSKRGGRASPAQGQGGKFTGGGGGKKAPRKKASRKKAKATGKVKKTTSTPRAQTTKGRRKKK